MSMPTLKLNEAKVLINSLNPTTRGAQLDLTDQVKADLKRLEGEVKEEGKRLLGEDFEATEGVLPESAHADYRWVLARIKRVLGSGSDSLVEPVTPAMAGLSVSDVTANPDVPSQDAAAAESK